MQGEEAYPTCGMDGVLVWMMPPLGDLGWYVMDCDDPVEDRYDHENEQPKCEIVQEWIVYLIDQLFGSCRRGQHDQQRGAEQTRQNQALHGNTPCRPRP
jgi:hypothetical protein